MKKLIYLFSFSLIAFTAQAQDLSQGLIANDLALHPMQPVAKPAYLQSIVDPSFGTTIRRISDAGIGGIIKPMYSTIQAWNADETRMILYNEGTGTHHLLDGFTYEFLEDLNLNFSDIEEIFWDFNDPNIFYYLDSSSDIFTAYNVNTSSGTTVVDLTTLVPNCTAGFSMGNDIQMMSADSDLFGFRCGESNVYVYKISSGELTEFSVGSVASVAPTVGPSGENFLHQSTVFDLNGMVTQNLNTYGNEHSCIGKLSNGNDAYFAVTFAEGPLGGCSGNLVAHDLETGLCTELISEALGYDYSQSGTHISALAHKNTTDAWVIASMMGYDQDGNDLLDQELVLVRADPNNAEVFRIGHHRADEDEFDYWGEPHASLSPSGTRILFGSDWSGNESGQSVDAYVVELPAFAPPTSTFAHITVETDAINVYPNPFTDQVVVDGDFSNYDIYISDAQGNIVQQFSQNAGPLVIDLNALGTGLYFISLINTNTSELSMCKILKQ